MCVCVCPGVGGRRLKTGPWWGCECVGDSASSCTVTFPLEGGTGATWLFDGVAPDFEYAGDWKSRRWVNGLGTSGVLGAGTCVCVCVCVLAAS
jgi:hypothetical protein